MNQFDQEWQKLTALARQAGETQDAAAPFGFATRVVAQAVRTPAASPWEVFERFALRGLVVAALLGVMAVVLHFPLGPATQADAYAGVDAVDEMIDLS